MFSLFKKEERAKDPSWLAVSGNVGQSANVDPRKAEGLSAVTACVNAISSSIAALPACVFFTEKDGNLREMPEHPLSRLIRNGVNDSTSWPELIESMMSDVLLFGNALCEKRYSETGELEGLFYIPWSWVNPVYLGNGRLAFDVTYSFTLSGAAVGERKRFLQTEVLHLKDRSDNGLLGRPRLERCAPVIHAAENLFAFTANLYKSGLFPSGAIEFAGPLTSDQRDILKRDLDEMYSGSDNAGRALVLSQGLTWKPLQMNAEQNELLQSRRFCTEEICRCFGVSPQIVGDLSDSSYNVASEMFSAFRQTALLPWVIKIQSLFNRGLLAEGFSLELDLSTLERADLARRWTMYETAVKNGILSVDEVRDIEGYGHTSALADSKKAG